MNGEQAPIPLGESVVDEVRAIREAIDTEVGHDLRKLAERARLVSEQARAEFGLPPATPAREPGASAPRRR